MSDIERKRFMAAMEGQAELKWIDSAQRFASTITQNMWESWQIMAEQFNRQGFLDSSDADGKGSLPWFVAIYNSGYEAGHHDTVEGGFTPIHHSDKDTYHEEQVMEILEDLNVEASRDTRPSASETEAFPNCDTCGNPMDYMPWHYSRGDERHLHACDQCWPKVNPSAGAVPEGLAETLVNDLFDIGSDPGSPVYRIQFMSGCLSDEKGCGGLGRTALMRWLDGRLQQLLTAAPTAPVEICPDEIHKWAESIIAREGTDASPSKRALDMAYRVIDAPTAPVEDEKGLTPKEAWWAGYRAGKGLPAEMPRQEAVAAPAVQGGGVPVAYMIEWDDGAVDLVEGPMPKTGEDPLSVTPLYTHPHNGEQPAEPFGTDSALIAAQQAAGGNMTISANLVIEMIRALRSGRNGEQGDTAPIPHNVAHARAMALTGMEWLRHNAPDQLVTTDGEQGEPDMFWDDNNPEDSGQECAQELADYCSQDLPFGETMIVDVQCAKRLPNRQMKIWVDDDDDLHWEWGESNPPTEREDGHE